MEPTRMLDTKRLLEQFLGGQSGDPRQRGQGGAGGFDAGRLGDIARNLGGQGGLGGLGGLAGGLGGSGGGALAGGLAALLLGSKQGRKLGGSALKIGGMALVGALAYRAYQDWQTKQQPAGSTGPLLPPPADTPFNPSSEAEQQSLARALLRAMIAAAKADGHIDQTEQKAIFAKMDELPLDADDKAFVMDELRAPLDVDAVARGARTPEQATEIYAASLLAVDVDHAEERAYLQRLATSLKLDPGLVRHIHATVEESVPVA
jgi:uncharacterized membrane protein YebE (DUF533 family)